MNSSDLRLQQIVQAATERHLLGERGYSLRVGNMALSFVIRYARHMTRLEVRTLLAVAELARRHPDDWQERALAEHVGGRDRDVKPVWPIPLILARQARQPWWDKIKHGDFPAAADNIPDHSIDAVITSPPYSNQRSGWYNSVSEQDYPAWTVHWMRTAERLLGDRGSVAIVISPHSRRGFVSRYVDDTLAALRADGWRQAGLLVWHKPDAAPLGRWNRPRLGHEAILWLSKVDHPYSNPKEGGKLSDRIGLLHGNGVMHQKDGPVKTGIARVSTVIRAPVGTIRGRGTRHPAQHPTELYEYLIKLMCPKRGVVLDPFVGSGTTAVAARRTGRHYLGYDASAQYVRMARQNANLLQVPRPPTRA